MLNPNIIQMKNKQKKLPPPPPIFDKNKLILDINNKLADNSFISRSLPGFKSVKLVDLKNPRRTWISYEYHLDIIYKINDKQYTMLPNNYYDEANYPLCFKDQLYNRLARIQQSINKGE